MRIKRFTARDLPTVVENIKEEFGLAAIILSQRESEGGVEVTAGVREEDLPQAGFAAVLKKETVEENKVSKVAPKTKPLTAPALGMAAYKKQAIKLEPATEPVPDRVLATLTESFGVKFDELKNLILDLAHRQSLSEKWRDHKELVTLYRHLLGTGLWPEYARSFVEKAAEFILDGEELIAGLRKAMFPVFNCLPEQNPPKLLVLTGPSGAGKTTSLVKLAAVSRQKLKTAIISLDTLKLGAAEQLTQYARIMGLGLKICQSRAEFLDAREIFGDCDLVLVDTSTRDLLSGSRQELTDCLVESGASLVPVLSATMKSEDLKVVYERVSSMARVYGVILSKIDETQSLGNIMNFLAGSRPALAYFSNGHRTPEDFIPAQADRFLDFWLMPVVNNIEVLS